MTVRELGQYRWLRREIDTLEHRLAVLETSALSPASPKLSGTVSGRDGDRMAGYIIRSDDLRRLLRDRRRQARDELLRLERFIACIPDSIDRQIITLRYADGYSWMRVASTLGGGNTPEGVRKRVQRCMAAMNEGVGGSGNKASKK